MLRFLMEMEPGEITREDLRMEPWKGPEEKGLGIPETSMKRFVERFKSADISDRPIRELIDIAGVRYESAGGGWGNPSKFIK
jgi:hypothetical protein